MFEVKIVKWKCNIVYDIQYTGYDSYDVGGLGEVNGVFRIPQKWPSNVSPPELF